MTDSTTAAGRDQAIDWLRGVVMALMALDHARDFFGGFRVRPTDLATTTPLLFATRWVTHFCAPVFVFLAGAAAALYAAKCSPAETRAFLAKRGLLLVLLEVTVVRLGWVPDPGYHFIVFQVIWALGASMLVLATLVSLPRSVIAIVGAAVVLLHNLLDRVHAAALGAWGPLWVFLHEQQTLHPAPDRTIFVAYPLVPWFAVMMLGYAFGPIARLPPERRRPICARLGAALVLAFVAVRAFDGYGDPAPWTAQPSATMTVLSFLNATKYPPSLVYLLMTLGPALLALAYAPRSGPRGLNRWLVALGQVPLFFYVAHLYLLRCASLPFGVLRFGAQAFAPPPAGSLGSPEWPLWTVYIAWVATLLILTPLCRRYAELRRRRGGWLRYL